MRLLIAWLCLAGATLVAQAPPDHALPDLLRQVGGRVQHYLSRAQTIVCLEIVRMLPLTASLGSDGTSRTVESELRLSWVPTDEGTASNETQTLRQVLRVNGHPPRKNDWRNCTSPEQQTVEPQPLAFLLPERQVEYDFKIAGRATIDKRDAIMIDFRERRKPTVDVSLVEGRDDCVSFDVEGGTRGRIWIDSTQFDVLRVDQSVTMIDIPLPKKTARFASDPTYWTLERMDTSIRFKAVTFSDPDETIVLPASVSSLRITRGSGTPRLRTMTEYLGYRRFLTAGRVVPPQGE